MISNLAARLGKYVENTPYGIFEPLSYVALIPVVSVIVRELRLDACEAKLWHRACDQMSLSRDFEKTCKAHFQGAIVQVVALTVLFPGVGYYLALIAAADALRTSYRAYKVSEKTLFFRIPGAMDAGFKKRMPHLIGW